jgi:hypothetical protein
VRILLFSHHLSILNDFPCLKEVTPRLSQTIRPEQSELGSADFSWSCQDRIEPDQMFESRLIFPERHNQKHPTKYSSLYCPRYEDT